MHIASQYIVVGDELDHLLHSESCDLKALNESSSLHCTHIIGQLRAGNFQIPFRFLAPTCP